MSDKDIRIYLPEFPKKDHVLTAKHLASYASEIRHYNACDEKYNTNDFETVIAIATLEHFAENLLAFKPCTNYLQSSHGWVLLSVIMERPLAFPFLT